MTLAELAIRAIPYVVQVLALGIIATGTVVAKVQMLKHYEDKKIKKKDLKPGDHIYVPLQTDSSGRSGSSGNPLLSYVTYHHGIYIGNEEVTDFGSDPRPYPVIRPLTKFLGSHEHCLYRREYSDAWAPEKTIKEARKVCRNARLNHSSYGPYSLMENNCEHYATKLKTGKHWSGQAEKALKGKFFFISWRYQNCNQQGVPGGTSSLLT